MNEIFTINTQASQGRRILLYVREDILCKIIKVETGPSYKSFFNEINPRKKKKMYIVLYQKAYFFDLCKILFTIYTKIKKAESNFQTLLSFYCTEHLLYRA